MASRKTSDDRRARIEAMRKAEASRERRNRLLTISISGVIVAGLVGFGVYVLNEENEEDKREEKLLAQPISGIKTWDEKKLGNNHVDPKPVTYEQTPPVGGDHHTRWLNCDRSVYKEPVPNENAVHSLEHGAVWVTYNDKAPKGDVEKLEKKVKETSYSMISPIKEQQGAIMLSAWGKQLTVDSADDERVELFFKKYVQGPQTQEPGAACAGGVTAK
ncbi:DUF3105 domain-containing protein [Streptomyces clavuligerus]|uniref:Membrane protein n=1 Tax=Streptomyces clavuligerus TaxID=1901 RepID=B5GXG8_STRCL|nr:DUF3105 domain-containing protein [Streptomyces clavuligerus]ANW20472.1 hypothetical protein BB341_20805 [Streptomyces clavuligerus]AXU15099.1 DUF3105 domain-containing protein [Streptomyces clavuligerus]EDY51014.1 membrane protein [Streptomyces clavuligerus]EFG06551.1 Membrane protein [Streptomyces clavuligerus]MBY6305160.1 DUF3105 domain-containing protein [Streptomyces clavuligerus]